MNAPPIVCPTHGRAGRVSTHENIAGVVFCVAESQAPLYKEAHPDVEQIVHPDTVVGLAPKRDWMLKEIGRYFSVDDDIGPVLDMSVAAGEKNVVPPEDVPRIIARAEDMAAEVGAYLYAFADDSVPLHYNPHKPFDLTGWAPGHCFGMRDGSDLWFKHEVLDDDFWISLLNAYYHRVMFKDRRYAFPQKSTFKNKGGLGAWRTVERHKESFDQLRAHFGTAVVHKKEKGKLGLTHPHQPKMNLPF